jgi:hypothetical protein
MAPVRLFPSVRPGRFALFAKPGLSLPFQEIGAKFFRLARAAVRRANFAAGFAPLAFAHGASL